MYNVAFIQAYCDPEKVKDVLSKTTTFDANGPRDIPKTLPPQEADPSLIICLSAQMSICLAIYASGCASVFQPICDYVSICLHLYICVYLSLAICLCVYLSICLPNV